MSNENMNITPEVKNSLLASYKNAVITANKVHGLDNIPVLVDLGLYPDQDVWALLKEMTNHAVRPEWWQSLDIRVNGFGYKPGTGPEVFVEVVIKRRKVFDCETHIRVALIKRSETGIPRTSEVFFEAVVCDFDDSHTLIFIDNRKETGLPAETVLIEKLKDRIVERFHDAGITIDAKIGKERLFIEPEEDLSDACLNHPKSVSLIKYITAGVVDSAIPEGMDAKITVTGKVKKDNGRIGKFHIRDRVTIE